MSLIKAIKAQLGLSVTPANNFTLTAEANNGTLKLARGNADATTQDLITVSAANVITGGSGATLVGNGPALSARLSGDQSIASGTQTVKLVLNNYDFDTAGILNGGTYQVKPLVAGYYQVSLVVQANSSSANQISTNIAKIYKNGSLYLAGVGQFGNSVNPSSQLLSSVSALIAMNGTTDYLEAYVTTVCGTTANAISSNTNLCVNLARAA